MATAKDCYTLTSYFEKKYNEHYGVKPGLNKYASRWGFDAMLQGETVQEVKSLIDYYFTTASPRRHSIDWFFYNYEKLMVARDDHKKDAETRERLRRESAERAEKWRNRVGNDRTESN